MQRIIVNVMSGAQEIVDLTPEEQADALARTAAENTPDLIKARLVAAVQAHLDATAQAHGYDSVYTACTYADEPAVPLFQAEGQALRAWRSLVWAHCHTVMAEARAGQRQVPTAAELIDELPALVL